MTVFFFLVYFSNEHNSQLNALVWLSELVNLKIFTTLGAKRLDAVGNRRR